MNRTNLIWHILKYRTILYDVVTSELVLYRVAIFIINNREITHVIDGIKYSRMDQIKFVEDSLLKQTISIQIF